MGNIKIIKGVFEEKLELQDTSIVAGFPSPADDYLHDTLDLKSQFWDSLFFLIRIKACRDDRPFLLLHIHATRGTKCRYNCCSYRCYNLYNKLKCFSLSHGINF